MNESEMVERVARRLYRHEWRERPPGDMTAEEAPYWREAARAAIEEHVRALREDRWIISRYKTLPDGQVTPEIYDAALSPTGRGGGE